VRHPATNPAEEGRQERERGREREREREIRLRDNPASLVQLEREGLTYEQLYHSIQARGVSSANLWPEQGTFGRGSKREAILYHVLATGTRDYQDRVKSGAQRERERERGGGREREQR